MTIMFQAIRTRINATSVVAVLALVFAMTGGAYAAKKFLITSTSQIKPSVLAQLKGKAGANGAPGPAGPAGPAGLAGAKGENGASGTNGTNGKDGVSVTSSKESAGANCKAGGSKFVSASGTTYACNGENGKTGFTETLPSKETETGDWSLYAKVAEGFARTNTSVSFVIPLAKAPTPHYIHNTGRESFYNSGAKAEEERAQPACPGSATEPAAEPGNLCVYAAAGLENDTLRNFGGAGFPQWLLPAVCSSLQPFTTCLNQGGGADKSGFSVTTSSEGKGEVVVSGTWAVSAE